MFELQDCDFHLAQRKYFAGKLSENKFNDIVRDCQKILIECCAILNNEPNNTIEKYYETSSKVSLKIISEHLSTLS